MNATTDDTTDDEQTTDQPTTYAVGLRCLNCGGTSTTVLPDPGDDDPDLDGMTWACPHCPQVETVGDGYEVTGFQPLAADEAEVDAIHGLDDQPADRDDDALAPSLAADYYHVVLKGKRSVDHADDRGVSSHTVRGNVSRARSAIRDHYADA